MVSDGLTSVYVMEFVCAILVMGEHLIGTAFLNEKLAYTTGCGRALNFNSGKDEVPRLEDNKGLRGVGVVGGRQSMVLGEVVKDFNGELGLCIAKSKEFVEVGCAGAIGKFSWEGGQIAVEWEAKRAADSGNATNDISTIYWRSVPSVDANMDCFDANFGVATVWIGCNSDGLVEELEESLDGNGLVVWLRPGLHCILRVLHIAVKWHLKELAKNKQACCCVGR